LLHCGPLSSTGTGVGFEITYGPASKVIGPEVSLRVALDGVVASASPEASIAVVTSRIVRLAKEFVTAVSLIW
jgi:hypothetical protein